MTWTYAGTPGTSTTEERRDATRFLVGDTDTNDQQITDEEITFSLAQAGDNVYRSAAICAKSLASKYARLVDTSVESVKSSYSQRAKQYDALAITLEGKANQFGGIGMPSAGGISISDMDSANDETDRVRPAFERDQFGNPPQFPDNIDVDWRR